MARDRYKYFRIETREILDGLSHGVMELERGVPAAQGLDNLLRLAHTLKGAARVVEQDGIAEAAHAIEDLLGVFRKEGAADGTVTDAILRHLDAIALDLAALGAEAPAPVEATPAAKAQPEPVQPVADFEAVRVELAGFDVLLESLAEAGTQLDALRRETLLLDQACRLADELLASQADAPGVHDLKKHLDHLRHAHGNRLSRASRELGVSRERANALRLVPAAAIFPELERAVRDTAVRLGKRVVFRPTGGEQRLDGHVLAGIRDALLHLINNGVDHGIEAPEARIEAGKPPEGTLSLTVERRGPRVAFVIHDDGRGVDLAAVQQAAARHALLTPAEAEALDLDAAVRLLFRQGFSTARTVSAVSGRGIGLDAVNALVAKCKGELRLETAQGQGTTLTLTVPVSLTSLSALLVELDGLVAAIPLDAVVQTLRLQATELETHGGTEMLMLDDRALPFQPLDELFSGRVTPPDTWSVVVLRAGDREVAVGAHRLIGMAELVVRPLPKMAGALPLVIGTALDADGTPQPVLDPQGLVAAATARTGAERPAEASNAMLPILVIDDSLTTRMLEQSILESAGFTVALATSAEEGLEMAKRQRYGLFIVDVEMPGMTGFDFVALTREDPRLAEVPAILVTSRAAPADRRRGLEVGARAYIVKGEFDQGIFLQTVRGLVG
ncbi:response regulator [bacterium]|nr:response regulator [bacterium]